MGTPEFAVESLKEIVKRANDEVVAVYTQPDKLVGRKQVLKFSDVKLKAKELGLYVLQPFVFDAAQVSFLQNLKPDVVVVVAYGKILPKTILKIPKFGCVNLHASLLPKYRGASPIQTSIVCGDSVSGVSAMFMTEKLDAGDVIDQVMVNIGENETAVQLSKKLAKQGASLLCKVLDDLSKGCVKRQVQDESLATYAPILTKKSGKINFKKTSFQIHKLICGLVPWPCAYCVLNGKMLKVYESRVVVDNFVSLACGQILNDKKRFIVGCAGGSLIEFLKVQLEGKKIMRAVDFLNGLHFNECLFLS